MKRTVSFAELAPMLGGILLLAACSSDSNTPAPAGDPKKEVATAMQMSMLADLNTLLQSAKDIQTAAPTPTGRGWDATQDAAAIESMKTAWTKARTAYEHTEGALAPIFSEIDATIDFRYDDFLDTLGAAGDQNLFDGEGVTGLHAVERILYSSSIPQSVVDFEAGLPGYKAAAFPATQQEAADFKTKLVAKMIADAQTLHDQWTPTKIAVEDAFTGLTGLMNEQAEKVNKAATGQEESRYSQRTMNDLRDNLVGTKAIYELFRPWLQSKTNATDANLDGKKIDTAIEAGFTALSTEYAKVSGAAFPAAPATWDAANPSAADLATPFGQLYTAVHTAVDPAVDGSVGNRMNAAARVLGLPEFME